MGMDEGVSDGDSGKGSGSAGSSPSGGVPGGLTLACRQMGSLDGMSGEHLGMI